MKMEEVGFKEGKRKWNSRNVLAIAQAREKETLLRIMYHRQYHSMQI
jgi:hypothetical protein